MHSTKMPHPRRALALVLMLAAGAALSGCGAMATNRLLDSVHQPVVAHHAYLLDLTSGSDGLPASEQARLDGWFGVLGLRYGDRIALDDPLDNPRTRAGVAHVAARYGLLLAAAPAAGAADAPHAILAGTVRVTVLRSTARVPHCPDLATTSESNFNNATSSNYGCAVNSNLAAMVADPDDLLAGAHAPATSTAQASDKAVWMHQAAIPTGQNAVTKTNTNTN